MAITRLGQLSGETQSTDDFILATGSTEPTISNTKAFTGSWSYRFSTTTEATGIGFASQSELRSHVRVNHNSITGSARAIILGFQELGTALNDSHVVVWNNATTNLEMYVDDTLVDSISVATAGFSTVDTWYSCGAVIKTGASGYFYFYLNGAEVLSYTGAVGTDLVGAYFGGRHTTTGWGSQAYFDDFYVDSYVGEAISAPSGKRFDWCIVNGAGENAEFTPSAGANYQCVDDAPPDDDTTYNKALTAGLKDTFTKTTFTLPADHVIRAVIPLAVTRKTDAGLDSKLILHLWDGLTYQESSELTLTTTYAEYFSRFTLQNDGSGWNATDLNAYEVGYESAGTF